MLRVRAALMARVRAFFAGRGYLEVETPLLAHAGAADAQIGQFVVNDPVYGTLYLQTSPEYAMKRLLLTGAGSIFQVSKAFRQGEVGRFHNPEFTLVEWYGAGYDRARLIEETCQLLGELIPDLACAPRIVAWAELFRELIGIDPLAEPTELLLQAAYDWVPSARGLTLEDRDSILDLLMSTALAPRFADDRLTVVVDYPPSQAALACLNEAGLADRFEVYGGALELANGFCEAVHHDEYAHRFAQEARKRQTRGLPAIARDERLLRGLAHAPLPPCAGCALGFDRAVMLATRASDIGTTLAFPIERA